MHLPVFGTEQKLLFESDLLIQLEFKETDNA